MQKVLVAMLAEYMERESSIRLSKWCLIHNAVFATWVESKIVCSVPPCLQVDISKA